MANKLYDLIRTGFFKARSYSSFHSGIEAMINLSSIFPGMANKVSSGPNQLIKSSKSKATMPGSEGGNNLMAKNLKELRNEDPKLAAAVEAEVKAASKPINAAVAAERKRLQAIDEIAPAINDEDLVHEAKYGDQPYTAAELALRATLNKTVDEGIKAVKQAYQR